MLFLIEAIPDEIQTSSKICNHSVFDVYFINSNEQSPLQFAAMKYINSRKDKAELIENNLYCTRK